MKGNNSLGFACKRVCTSLLFARYLRFGVFCCKNFASSYLAPHPAQKQDKAAGCMTFSTSVGEWRVSGIRRS